MNTDWTKARDRQYLCDEIARLKKELAAEMLKAKEYRTARDKWGNDMDAVEDYLISEGIDECALGDTIPLVDSVRSLVAQIKTEAHDTRTRLEKELSVEMRRGDNLFQMAQRAGVERERWEDRAEQAERERDAARQKLKDARFYWKQAERLLKEEVEKEDVDV